MATTIQFYHLLSTSPERALPKLMEKALSTGSRVVVLQGDQTKLKSLSDALWLSNPNGFLPHGGPKDKHAAENPIILTAEAVNPNGAEILCILDGSTIEGLDEFSKVLDIFDGADPRAVDAARKRWSTYKDAGYTLQYNKQQPGGGWKSEAEAA